MPPLLFMRSCSGGWGGGTPVLLELLLLLMMYHLVSLLNNDDDEPQSCEQFYNVILMPLVVNNGPLPREARLIRVDVSWRW